MCVPAGRVAEWSIAAVLKTVEPKGSGGSNPSPSARFSFDIKGVYADAMRGVQRREISSFSEQEGNPGTFGAKSPEKSPERCSACVPEKKHTVSIRAGQNPPDMWDLYISLARTADHLGETVDEITKWRRDPALGFPRSYSFDRPAEHGRPAIRRGPFFRLDEIQRWQRRAGDFGDCGDPPDKRETAALAGNRRDGSDQFCTLNFTGPDAKKQGTPCAKCALYDGANLRVLHRQRATLGRDYDVLVRPSSGRKWSACQLAATRDPGAHCHFFQGRADG